MTPSSQALAALSTARTVCIIKPDALGDFILALPALHALRTHCPDKKIVLLVSPLVYPLATAFDVADCVLPIPLFTGPQGDVAAIQKHALAVRTLHPDPLDICFVLRWDADYYAATPLAYAMGATQRVGYASGCSPVKAAVNPGYDGFLTHAVLDTTIEHESNKYLKIMGYGDHPLGYPTPRPLSAIQKDQLQQRVGLPSTGFIGVGLSASRPKKKLDAPAWIAVLQALRAQFQQPMVLFGGPEDQPLGDCIAQATGALNLCGKTTVVETLHLIAGASAAVAVDSFFKHAAACRGIPVVELSCQAMAGDPGAEYGGVRFGAWGVAHRIVKPARPLDVCPVDGCSAEHSHCISGITPTQVVQACEDVFPG